jgi:hypothetical protein
MSGQIAGNPLFVCGAEAATYTRNAQRRVTLLLLRRAATAGWRMERKLIPPIIGVADTPKKSCREGRHREHPKPPRVDCSPQISSLQVSPSRRHSEATETSSSNQRQARFRWFHHPQQQGRIYGPLHSSKQVSQSRPLL